ncbi:MAG: fumarylacetoacetate hydrolase family protein [Haliscomenobacter sp.]|nr:fumarylacetoacetate hydrolase family protein [Haliscomenobacter sp.]
MDLFRYWEGSSLKCGVRNNGRSYAVSGLFPDYDGVFFADGGLQALAEALNSGSKDLIPIDHPQWQQLAAPFATPSKIVCIGLNYADHARETGAEIPAEPILFLKSNTAYSGPNDDIMLPRGSQKTDWEVELAVVISRKARYVEENEALEYVAGYCLHNDLSEREFQLERGGTWDKGKGCDTFAPMGPYLVTPDSISDADNLDMWLKVNGQTMQKSNTRNLIFKIPALIAYTSQFMTLLPGDVISTGTPPGVGLGLKPPVFLQPGDVVELGIQGLGEARQTVVPFKK